MAHPCPLQHCIASVAGNIVAALFSHYVTTSSASSLCSTPSGKTAAPQKKPIAGFPSSSNKHEGVLPADKPAGLYSAKGQLTSAIHPVYCSLGERSGFCAGIRCTMSAQHSRRQHRRHTSVRANLPASLKLPRLNGWWQVHETSCKRRWMDAPSWRRSSIWERDPSTCTLVPNAPRESAQVDRLRHLPVHLSCFSSTIVSACCWQ